jgi:hypothetical protein
MRSQQLNASQTVEAVCVAGTQLETVHLNQLPANASPKLAIPAIG